MKTILALRMDDPGASTKHYERYTNNRWLSIGPLRDRRWLGAWGPYREMTTEEWQQVFTLLERFNARLTVAITASWVEEDGSLSPFDTKFPAQLGLLREGVKQGRIEIANHGLTHCVLKDRAYLPRRFFGGNRKSHREFWPSVARETQREHVARSQEILTRSFGKPPEIFVPPGNVFTPVTLEAAREFGIKVVNCQMAKTEVGTRGGLRLIDNREVFAFHDREIVLKGQGWFESHLLTLAEERTLSWVSEL